MYGAERSQLVATDRQSGDISTGLNQPKPLPPVATSWRSERMVRRVIATASRRCEQVPLSKREEVDPLECQVLRTRGPTGLDCATLTLGG